MTLNNLYKSRSLIKILAIGRVYRSLSMEAEMSSANWRGVPIYEIIGSQSPWGAPEFPLVTPGHNHTVLYHIPSNGNIGDRQLQPQVGQDKWDSDHVRMPCSTKSLYPVEDSNGQTRLKKRWEMIEEALQKPIRNSHQLADAILSYNTKFKTIWKFRALHSLFNEHLDEEESEYFFTVTLPQIAKLAMDLPKLVRAPIPLLTQHKNHSISLTQQQIASLLANAFFCTFPRRNTTKRVSEYASYPYINFSSLYECAGRDDILEKLTCICHYFRRVGTKGENDVQFYFANAASRGVATFSRRSVSPRACPDWAQSVARLAATPLHVDPDGRIEDAHGLIQLDFANKYLGGGVLGHGSVQEEIRFAICPELMLSMLFTEVLRPNEALLMIGCERYSQYTGYGRSFRWTGNFEDATPLDSAGRRRGAVLAIDALPYASTAQEYRKEMITRELNKAWVGFSFYTDDQPFLQFPGIATGNWGCGAFGGSPQLKSLIQMMACAQARRPMAYYTFGDTEIRDEVISVYNLLARYNVTVGQLYQYICQFSTSEVCQLLHPYLQQVLIDEGKKNNPSKESSTQPDDMDTSTSPQSKHQTNTHVKEDLDNGSPDLFSQDEEQNQKESDSQTSNSTGHRRKDNNTPNESKTSDSRNKMASHTMRLFDELNRFDEDSGKLKLNVSVKDNKVTSENLDVAESEDIFTSDSEIEENKVKNTSSSEKKMAASDKTLGEGKAVANTSRLFDEMQKFDDEHGRLNLCAPHTSLLNDSKNVVHDSDTSMERDRLEVSPDVKKKIAKKITDYFTKKSS